MHRTAMRPRVGRETKMKQVNIYRNMGEWCYALFVDGEFDTSGTVPVDNEQEARDWAAKEFPGSRVERVSNTEIV